MTQRHGKIHVWHDPSTDVVHLLTDAEASVQAGLDAVLDAWQELMQLAADHAHSAAVFKLGFDALDTMREMTAVAVLATEPEAGPMLTIEDVEL